MDALFNGDVLSAIVNALLPILVPFVVAALAIAAKSAADFMRAKAGKEQWALIEILTATAVNAAAQELSSQAGQDKKAYAVQALKSSLKKHGITLEDKTISASVEAAVKAAKDATTK